METWGKVLVTSGYTDCAKNISGNGHCSSQDGNRQDPVPGTDLVSVGIKFPVAASGPYPIKNGTSPRKNSENISQIYRGKKVGSVGVMVEDQNLLPL